MVWELTAKTVRETPSPMFDDPFFRYFFGAPGYENVPRERREQALGSGVIISEDGYILTNNHVVDGADEIKVVLAEDKKEFDAKVIGTDPQTDIAVIKVEGKNLHAITITDSDKKDHTYEIAKDAKIMCDNKECKLDELKKNMKVKLTLEKDKVTKIEATK